MTLPPSTLSRRKRRKALKRRKKDRWLHRNLDHNLTEDGDRKNSYSFFQPLISFGIIIPIALIVMFVMHLNGIGTENLEVERSLIFTVVPFVAFSVTLVIVVGVLVMGISNRELMGTDKIDIHNSLWVKIFVLYLCSFLIGGVLTFGAGDRWTELWEAYKAEHPFAGAIQSFFETNEFLISALSIITFMVIYAFLDRFITIMIRIKWNMENHARKARHTARLDNHPSDPIPDSALTAGAVLWLTPHVSSSRGVYAVVQPDQSLLLPSGAIRPASELSLYFTLVRPLSPESYPSTEPGTLGLPKYGNSTVPLLLSSSGWSKPGSPALLTPAAGSLRYFEPPSGHSLMQTV